MGVVNSDGYLVDNTIHKNGDKKGRDGVGGDVLKMIDIFNRWTIKKVRLGL